jgi:hypothetical protein
MSGVLVDPIYLSDNALALHRRVEGHAGHVPVPPCQRCGTKVLSSDD